MTNRRGLSELVIGFLLLIASAVSAQGPLQVGKITVRNLDVFSPNEAARGWFYRATDFFHVQTRESIIRKFLLFREGDPYNPHVLAESERNLRRLAFLKSVSVTAEAPHDGVVDVDVTTQDSWTTEPVVSFGREGGVTTYGFQLKEKNLLGTGRGLLLSYDKGIDRVTRSVIYRDPQVFGPYWNGKLIYAVNSDGYGRGLSLERPFFSVTARWALHAAFDNIQQTGRVYRDGRATSEFDQDHVQILIDCGLALTANEAHARRLAVGLESLDDRFRHSTERPDDLLPDRRKFRYLFLAYEDVRNDFVKLNCVNKGLRYEDFNLARQFTVRMGISPTAFDVPRTSFFWSAIGGKGWRIDKSSFLQAELGFKTRWDDAPHNKVFSASLGYVRRYDTRLIQTTVSRLQFDRGYRLDRDVQFIADGITGLRAYRLHAFAGDKRVIGNVEHRIFFGRELLQIVSPGAAVFFDIGAATPPDRPLRFFDLRSDVGAGLRLGLARAESHNIIRLDVAYALNRDPLGRHGVLVSFSAGQAF